MLIIWSTCNVKCFYSVFVILTAKFLFRSLSQNQITKIGAYLFADVYSLTSL